jgi:hypothetical protein
MNAFRFLALPAAKFLPMFSQSDAELRAAGARRLIVDRKPGSPCRVSLADAEVGEAVLLLPFAHHDVASPYRAVGPIFVRQNASTASPVVGEVPVMFRHRLLSLRADDAQAMMTDGEVGTTSPSLPRSAF